MLTKYYTKVSKKQKDIHSACILLSKSTGFIKEITYSSGLTRLRLKSKTPIYFSTLDTIFDRYANSLFNTV